MFQRNVSEALRKVLNNSKLFSVDYKIIDLDDFIPGEITDKLAQKAVVLCDRLKIS